MRIKIIRDYAYTHVCYPRCRRWRCEKHCDKVTLWSNTRRECERVNPMCGKTCTNNQCYCGHNCPCQLYLLSNPKACDGKVSIENGHCKCKWILNMMLAIYMILIDSNCSWKIFVVKTIKWSLIQLNFKIKLSIITSFLLSAIIMASKLLVLSHASSKQIRLWWWLR